MRLHSRKRRGVGVGKNAIFFINPMTQFIIQDNELSPPSSRSPERIRNPPHLHMKPSAKPNYRNARKHSWKWLQAVNRTQKLYFLNCQQTENQPNRFFFCKTFKLWSNVKSGLLRIFGKEGKREKGNRLLIQTSYPD